jgi:PhnB protein
MQVQTYLNFNGRCEEALAFYKQQLGAEVTMIMRMKESPDPAMQAPPDMAEKIMHSAFKIGSTTLMATDGMSLEKAAFKGVTLSLNVTTDAEARRLFAALSEGGSVQMPLMKTFWASSWGTLTDKFGVPWMVNVEA